MRIQESGNAVSPFLKTCHAVAAIGVSSETPTSLVAVVLRQKRMVGGGHSNTPR